MGKVGHRHRYRDNDDIYALRGLYEEPKDDDDDDRDNDNYYGGWFVVVFYGICSQKSRKGHNSGCQCTYIQY